MVYKDIKEKYAKIKELGITVDIYANTMLTREKSQKIEELKDRLQFKLAVLEDKGADEKIAAMEKMIKVLKDKK